MIGFLVGLLLGGLVGVVTMALLQLSRNGKSDDEKEKEEKANERDYTDD